MCRGARRAEGHGLRDRRRRRHHHPAATRAAQRLDRPDEHRVPVVAGAGRRRPVRAGRGVDRSRTWLLRRCRHACARGPCRAGRLRPGDRAGVGQPWIRGAPRVRRRVRLSLRHTQAHHRGGERAGGRSGIRAGVLLRSALRRRRRQADRRPRTAGPPRRVRAVVATPPARGPDPSGRRPAVESGGAGRGGGRHGSRQQGDAPRRALGHRVRVRPHLGDRGLPRVPRRHQAPALHRPPPRRRHGGPRRRRTAARHDDRPRLRRGRGRAVGAPSAAVRRSPGSDPRWLSRLSTVSERNRPGTTLAAALLDPALYSTDPHPLYARLRAEAPVAWNKERGFWALSKHADVQAVENDHDTFCAGRGILVEEIGTKYASPPTMMHSTPPVNTRCRRLVHPPFKPSVVRAREPVVRARTKALVARFEGDTATDVVPLLSVPLPLQVISEILGVPDDEWERCYEWSEAVIPGATDWPEERRAQLMAEMVEYLVGAAKDRRARPRDDVVTQLAQVEIDGERLSDDELGMFLVQLLVAGNETTRDLISSGLLAFADHSGQWGRLRADRSLVPAAVEEMLRWSSPVVSFMRTATHDTQ